jgi:hypothetical protein
MIGLLELVAGALVVPAWLAIEVSRGAILSRCRHVPARRAFAEVRR